jgi:hypothetical protein
MSAYRAVVQLTGFPGDAAWKSPSKAVPSPSQLPRDRIQPVQASIHSISLGPCTLPRSPHHKQLLTSQNFSRLSTCIDQHLHLKLTNTASFTTPADASWGSVTCGTWSVTCRRRSPSVSRTLLSAYHFWFCSSASTSLKHRRRRDRMPLSLPIPSSSRAS